MGQMKKRHSGGSYSTHVKKGDEVLVLAGRSLGERGRIVSVDPQRERAIVEGANMITKHQRPQGFNQSAASQQQSGRIQKPAPVHVSNLMIVCPSCSKPTRVAHKVFGERNLRACKNCGEALDKVE